MKNKRGVSLILSYIILVLIGIALAVLVYSFLKVYVPKFQTPECPDDISLAIQSYSCSTNNLSFVLSNNGLFNIDSVHLRVSPQGRVKVLIDSEIRFLNGSLAPQPLVPGQTYSYLSTSTIASGSYDLELQPKIFTGKALETALCRPIKQNVVCS